MSFQNDEIALKKTEEQFETKYHRFRKILFLLIANFVYEEYASVDVPRTTHCYQELFEWVVIKDVKEDNEC